jgi:hypothetical protein
MATTFNKQVVNDQFLHYVDTENLKVGALVYPNKDSTAGNLLATNGNGSIGFIDPKSLRLLELLDFSQVSGGPIVADLAVGDHVKFNFNLLGSGEAAMDTTTPYTNVLNVPSLGRLSTTSTLFLKAHVADVVLATPADSVTFTWVNANTGVPILGTSATVKAGPAGLNNQVSANPVVGFTPASLTPVRYELQITGLSAPGALISYNQIIVEAYFFTVV